MTVVTIPARDTKGLSSAFSWLNVSESENEGRTKGDVRGGERTPSGSRSSLKGRESVPCASGPATQEQEALPGIRKSAWNRLQKRCHHRAKGKLGKGAKWP